METRTNPKLILGLVAAVVVPFGAVATAVMLSASPDVAGSTETHQLSEASQMFMPVAETPEPAPTQVADFGATVQDGNFSFEVTDVRRTTATVDLENIFFERFAEGEFVTVNYVLTNVSGESQTFFPLSSTLTDGTTTYPVDDYDWVAMGSTSFDLGPGECFPTSVMFDVPEGTDLRSIEFHGSPSSEGVTVDL